MKKIVSLGAAASIAALSVISASAADTVTLKAVGPEKVTAGEEITIKLDVDSVAGAYTDALGGKIAVSGLEIKGQPTAGSNVGAFMGNIYEDGAILMLVNNALSAGETVLTFTYAVTAAAGEKVSFEFTPAANTPDILASNGKFEATVTEKGTDPEKADLTKLNKAIADGKAVDASKYTEETVKAVNDAVAAAEKITDANTQAEVDAAEKAITDAIAALKEKGGDPEKTDLEKAKEYLAAAQEAASKLDKTKYTEESYKDVTDAVAAAEKLGADADAATVAAAAQAINDAIGALKPPVPDTGVALAIVPVALAAAGVVVAKKKRS